MLLVRLFPALFGASLLVPLSGCASSPSARSSSTARPATAASVEVPPASGAEDSAQDEPEPPRARSDCPVSSRAALQHEYEEGVRLLEASRDGDYYLAVPYGQAMTHLRRAAEGGHLEAQYLFGARAFGNMFTAEAPRAEQEQDYVMALAFLVVAGRRGHEKARSFIEGLPDLGLDDSGRVNGALPEPLDSLPDGWVARALEEADALGECHRFQRDEAY